METQFANVMSEHSDEKLHLIISQRERYEPEACLAAIEELERRSLATPQLLEDKQKTLEQIRLRDAEEQTSRKGIIDGFALLKPSGNYFYTPILLYLNVAVWLVMILVGVDPIQPSVEHLIAWGGNLRGLTLDGEPWRLFTSTFMHGGAMHLAFNMYGLVMIGAILEPAFGKNRYLFCYIAAGILASITSIAFNDNIVSVGASGAIFGLDGILLALLVTKNINIPQESRKNLLTSTLIFIGYNLMFGFAKEGIDNAAHIGGLVSGFIFGFLYSSIKENPERAKVISGAIIAGVVLAVVIAPLVIRNTFREYDQAIQLFTSNEEKALWMYKEPMPAADQVLAFQKRVQSESIVRWKENIKVLRNLKDMPEAMQQRINMLINYSELRIKSCEAISTFAGDPGDQNEAKVAEIDKEIENAINKLEALSEQN